MSMSAKFILATVFLIMSILAVWRTGIDTTPIHYHAGFVVYIDGNKQDYSGYQYMNITPCSEHNTHKDPEDEQIEKAHLHDGVGEVVHVHRSGARWKDLFVNLGIKGIEEMKLTTISPSGEISDGLRQPIKPNESLIFLFNSPNVTDRDFVSAERIAQVEQMSELCASD